MTGARSLRLPGTRVVAAAGALALTVSLVLVAGAGPAAADTGSTPPEATLAAALQQLEQLNQRVDSLTLQVATLQVRVTALTTGFERDSERITLLQERQRRLWAGANLQTFARLQASPLVAQSARVRSQIVSAHARLLRLQQRAVADPVVTQLFTAQAKLDTLTAQRDAALEAAANLQAAGIVVPVTTSGTSTGYGAWAAEFLQALGAPACQNNLVAMVAWQAQEGTTAAWNPLATTLQADGATDFNGVGVKNYPTLASGLAATVDTLQYGLTSDGYGPIVAALQACAPPDATAAAINQSLWCRGCAGGRYVTGILPAVEANYTRFATGS